jgi:hypothetical protein
LIDGCFLVGGVYSVMMNQRQAGWGLGERKREFVQEFTSAEIPKVFARLGFGGFASVADRPSDDEDT